MDYQSRILFTLTLNEIFSNKSIQLHMEGVGGGWRGLVQESMEMRAKSSPVISVFDIYRLLKVDLFYFRIDV